VSKPYAGAASRSDCPYPAKSKLGRGYRARRRPIPERRLAVVPPYWADFWQIKCGFCVRYLDDQRRLLPQCPVTAMFRRCRARNIKSNLTCYLPIICLLFVVSCLFAATLLNAMDQIR
jgi:hypothetical protein